MPHAFSAPSPVWQPWHDALVAMWSSNFACADFCHSSTNGWCAP